MAYGQKVSSSDRAESVDNIFGMIPYSLQRIILTPH